MDKTVHAVETGAVPRTDVAVALEAMFRVGEPGGKTRDRFDALMQALEADQDGPIIAYKSLFEEDREYNQGDFASRHNHKLLNIVSFANIF